MIHYEYVDRMKCTCGYLWSTVGTNPPATICDTVICKCGSSSIINGVKSSEGLPIDENEFKQAVAEELLTDISNITIIQYVG